MEPGGIDVVLFRQPDKDVCHITVIQILGRYVHRNAYIPMAGLFPYGQLFRCLFPDVMIHPVNVIRAFQNRDKIAWHNQSPILVEPAGQRLRPMHLSVQTDLGLQEQPQLPVLQGIVKIVQDLPFLYSCFQQALFKPLFRIHVLCTDGLDGHSGTVQHLTQGIAPVQLFVNAHLVMYVIGPAHETSGQHLQFVLQRDVRKDTMGNTERKIVPADATVQRAIGFLKRGQILSQANEKLIAPIGAKELGDQVEAADFDLDQVEVRIRLTAQPLPQAFAETFHIINAGQQIMTQVVQSRSVIASLPALIPGRYTFPYFRRFQCHHLNGTVHQLPGFHLHFHRHGIDHILPPVQNFGFGEFFMGNTGVEADTVLAAAAASPYGEAVFPVIQFSVFGDGKFKAFAGVHQAHNLI